MGFEEHGFEAITVTVSVREGGERGEVGSVGNLHESEMGLCNKMRKMRGLT